MPVTTTGLVRTWQELLNRLSHCYRIDPRSFGLMRISLSLVILADLFIRAQALEAHYSNDGLLPLQYLHNLGWKTGYWSFHAWGGSVTFQQSLFFLHGLFAVMLLLGYRTRTTSLILWAFTVSLHNRNIWILQSGDDLLRITLLWGVLLPWSKAWSLDRRRRDHQHFESPLLNFGFLVFLGSVYLFTAIHKSAPEWHREGSAIYYALSLDQLRLTAGDLLYAQPALMKMLTHFVLWSEYTAGILIMLPLPWRWPRILALCLLLLLHLAIGSTLYVGLFFVIGISTAFALFPFRTKEHTAEHPIPSSQRILVHGFAVVLIIASLTVNISTLPAFPYSLNRSLSSGINFMRMDHFWGMFSPGILRQDGWYQVTGLDSKGARHDLLHNRAVIGESKPLCISSEYKSDRWRKLAENMQRDEFSFLRPLYCKYVLREWNRTHAAQPMRHALLYFFEEENLADYKTTTPQKKLFSSCSE